MDSLLVASDENAKQIPNMELCQRVYRYEYAIETGQLDKAENLKASIIATITEDAMAPHYTALCAKYGWTVDEEKESAMR